MCFLSDALIGWDCEVWSSDMQRYYSWNWTEAVQPLCRTACGYTSSFQGTTLCALKGTLLCYVGTADLCIWHRFSLHALLFKDCKIPETFCLESIKQYLVFCFSLYFTYSHSETWNFATSYKLYWLLCLNCIFTKALTYKLQGRASDSSTFL